MRALSAALLAAASLCATTSASPAADRVEAILAGHAILPALTMVPAPADAPASFQVSGKYTAPDGRRVDAPGTIDGISDAGGQKRPTGIATPFVGQPVQGFSGIRSLGDGRFLVLSDNGFGSKANSPDAMLMFHELEARWPAGRIVRAHTGFLHDPDGKVPFRITAEATRERYLTGADLDIESIQPVGDHLWFGDEFGPFLIETDRSGKVLGVYDTVIDGRPIRSPDNPYLAMPPKPGPVTFEAKRSKGFEGMAVAPDGSRLYPLLEGPIMTGDAAAPEQVDGKAALRILEFDTARRAWTGRSWFYQLEDAGNAIGDFNLVDATHGLVIERDNFEGDPADACTGEVTDACIAKPAAFKRIYLIELGEPGRPVRKIAYLDLMDIADPNHVARQGGRNGRFTFPFVTIEDVDVVDGSHIVVGNDNNLPFSAGRFVDRADADELVLLDVGDFLQRR